jgi:hypothetical protein
MGALNASTPRYFRNSHNVRRRVNVNAKGTPTRGNDDTTNNGKLLVPQKGGNNDTTTNGKVITSSKGGKVNNTNKSNETFLTTETIVAPIQRQIIARSNIPRPISSTNRKFYEHADRQLSSQSEFPVRNTLNEKQSKSIAATAATKGKQTIVFDKKNSTIPVQSFYNYYEPLQEDTMPKLATDSVDIPSISDLSPVPARPSPSIAPDQYTPGEEEWQPVPSKKKGTASIILNPYAKTLAPFVIPKGSGINRDNDVSNKLRLPTALRISPPKSMQVQYNVPRILAAVLLGIQQVTPTASLSPLSVSDNDLPRINNIHQIPDDPELLLKYIENPRAVKNGTFYANIVINSDYEIHALKRDATFRQWITNERLHIEYYPLKTKTPMNVGFLYKINPRDDTVNLHCTRIRQLLPAGSPEFHLVKQPLYTGRSKALVLVMKADGADVPKLAQMMNVLNSQRADLEYYPWEDYLALNRLQRQTIINNQNTFNSTFRSFLINGFIDNDDDIPMVYLDDDPQTMEEDRIISPFETMGVTTYLRTIPKSGKGTLLFAYVFPPVLGIREVLVTHSNASEAGSFVRAAMGELARDMNAAAIQLVFQNPDAATEASSQIKWMPHSRTHEIPEAISTESDNRSPPKRFKATNIYQGHSYASMAKRSHQQDKRPSMSSDSTTTGTTDITANSKIELLEKENASFHQELRALKQTVSDLAASANPQVVQEHIRDQLELHADKLEERFNLIVEEKIGQHTAELDNKLDGVMVTLNNQIETGAERDRMLEEDRLATQAFQAMMTRFVEAASGTPAAPARRPKVISPRIDSHIDNCPMIDILPRGEDDSDSDYVEESVFSSEVDTSMGDSESESVSSESSDNSFDTAFDEACNNPGGSNRPISIDTDSSEDTSVDASI